MFRAGGLRRWPPTSQPALLLRRHHRKRHDRPADRGHGEPPIDPKAGETKGSGIPFRLLCGWPTQEELEVGPRPARVEVGVGPHQGHIRPACGDSLAQSEPSPPRRRHSGHRPSGRSRADPDSPLGRNRTLGLTPTPPATGLSPASPTALWAASREPASRNGDTVRAPFSRRSLEQNHNRGRMPQ